MAACIKSSVKCLRQLEHIHLRPVHVRMGIWLKKELMRKLEVSLKLGNIAKFAVLQRVHLRHNIWKILHSRQFVHLVQWTIRMHKK